MAVRLIRARKAKPPGRWAGRESPHSDRLPLSRELAAVARPRRRGVGDFTGYDEPLRACAPAARVADRTGVRPDA